jgi:hypothetical protein
MASPQVCPRCGAMVAADAAWCSKCGLRPSQMRANPPASKGGTSRAAEASASYGSSAPLWPAGSQDVRAGSAVLPSAWRSLSSRGKLGVALALVAGIGVVAAIGGNTGASAGTSSPSGTPYVGVAGSDQVGQSAPTATANATSTVVASLSTAPINSAAAAAETPTPTPTATPTPQPSATATPKPTPKPTAKPAPLAVTISSLPASVAPNSDATLVAVTSPGAMCRISVKYHSGTISTAKGLKPRPTAGPSGTVSWTWTIGPSTKAGTSTATVTCTLGSRSGSKSRTFTVS